MLEFQPKKLLLFFCILLRSEIYARIALQNLLRSTIVRPRSKDSVLISNASFTNIQQATIWLFSLGARRIQVL
jgi:hypothetical protein